MTPAFQLRANYQRDTQIHALSRIGIVREVLSDVTHDDDVGNQGKRCGYLALSSAVPTRILRWLSDL